MAFPSRRHLAAIDDLACGDQLFLMTTLGRARLCSSMANDSKFAGVAVGRPLLRPQMTT
jgi:hypothetical protein